MTTTRPPGLRPERLATLVRRSVDAMALDLAGRVVLTEAATGAYVVTPVLAALAGAHVRAVTRSTRYGTVDDVVRETMELAHQLGVAERIDIHPTRLTRELAETADVVTNSGYVRPIDASVANWMRPSAVVPLMFEAWEIDLGRDDVNLQALRERRIRFAGTNERHPLVDVFSYLGPMAIKLLADAAVSVYGAKILLICDNPFRPYLEDGLGRGGASVVARSALVHDDLDERLDAIVIAMKPGDLDVINDVDVEAIADRCPATVLAQFWGDVPRDRCAELGVASAPSDAPGRGHMGVLPSAVGPEPIVRLQAGGLKVAEILLRDEGTRSDADREYIDEF